MIKVGDWIRIKGKQYPFKKVTRCDSQGCYFGDYFHIYEVIEKMPTSPQDYIGMRGVFYDKHRDYFLGKLIAVYDYGDGYPYHVFDSRGNTTRYQYFIPCETTSTNTEDLKPENVFTLGPNGVVHA